ncbi:MAG: NADH-ubiquinone/plastoquinone oxidoreductase subunit 6 [Desulfobacteraceae bacterium]|nr:MAG: NADH-ubiquinone/plastoquinone oxidoreductase subunit 6 [Desulfobacteraceae bacterium]
MSIYSFLFYILAAVILVSTAVAITRRNLVHAVIYLVVSFFGSAMLFYLLGAPFLAAIEIIIYAGAIMILFLFIVMMINVGHHKERLFPARQCLPAALFGLVFAVVGILLTFDGGRQDQLLRLSAVSPGEFGRYLFQNHWLAIEIVSFLLLIALVGALYLGKLRITGEAEEEKL